MKKTIFASTCILLALTLLVHLSSSATYNPWVDLDESGDVDIFDVVTLAGSYQTTGDPTKNVHVVNWPVARQQVVWYGQTSDDYSDWYNASGFGHMHLVWRVRNGLSAGEVVTVETRVHLDGPAGGWTEFPAVATNITAANDRGTLSIPVPAEIFQFHLDIATGTTATVDLAFYLTYA